MAAKTFTDLHLSSAFTDSAQAMAAILALHFPTGTILDVNYGHGVFYKQVDRVVTGVDIRPTGHVIANNKALPFADNSFDIGVCDPPYKRGDGRKYEQRYGKAPKTETQVTRSYYAAMAELLRVARHGLIIKCQDGTDGHRFHARTFHLMQWMKEQTGLDPHDIACIARPVRANTMVQGQPHFFKQAVSQFLIYRWKGKAPWRGVRF